MSAAYKTLRNIDGKDYIELAEHEDIVVKLMDFSKAIEDVRSAISDISQSTKELGGSLRELGEI